MKLLIFTVIFAGLFAPPKVVLNSVPQPSATTPQSIYQSQDTIDDLQPAVGYRFLQGN